MDENKIIEMAHNMLVTIKPELSLEKVRSLIYGNKDKWIQSEEAKELTGWSLQVLYYRTVQGQITVKKNSFGRNLYDREELEKLLGPKEEELNHAC